MQKLRAELEYIQKTNAQLAAENKELEKEIDLLKNDVRYLEQIARRELGLVKQNELVYHLQKTRQTY